MQRIFTQSKYDRTLSLPFGFPQTDMLADTSIVLSSIKIDQNTILRLRWASLYVTKITRFSGVLDLINSAYDAVYLALYSGNFSPLDKPAGTPLVYVGCGGVEYRATNYSQHWDFRAPDTYTLIAVNNTRSHDYQALATGTVRIII